MLADSSAIRGESTGSVTITTGAAQVATNVSALTALFAATLGSPVVKLAAFTYGVRGAVSGRRKKA